MSTHGRLPPEVLRSRYVQAHKALQAAIAENAKLKLRVQILEAENKLLHAQIEEKVDA